MKPDELDVTPVVEIDQVQPSKPEERPVYLEGSPVLSKGDYGCMMGAVALFFLMGVIFWVIAAK